MTIKDQPLPLAKLAQIQHPDAEPKNENVYCDWPEVIEACEKNKETGQHEYSIADDFIRCVHCGAESEL